LYQETHSLIILAGGESCRMGTDKADLEYAGQTFLEMQLQKGAQLGIEDTLVSGYRGSRCAFPIVKDRMPKRGPLGGLEACLRVAKHPKCLVLSVDTPLVSVSELEQLITLSCSTSASITILKANGREQPLIGVYDRSLADAMLQEITERKGSVFAFINRIGYHTYESAASPLTVSNINTPEEYQAILEHLPRIK